MGRPSSYTDAIAQEICDRLSQGEPLAQICRDEGMPGLRTVYDWQDAKNEAGQPLHEGFAARIARAREDGEEIIAADCLAIADDGRNDWMEKENGDQSFNKENVLRSKLRVDTRLKLLSKWNPRRYGEATLLKHADADGNNIDLAAAMAAARERTGK